MLVLSTVVHTEVKLLHTHDYRDLILHLLDYINTQSSSREHLQLAADTRESHSQIAVTMCFQ